MGDGTKESPYTREDVLRLIKANGGTAEGLDLSEKVFEEGIDLRKLDLTGIILKKADLRFAHLEEADLRESHLEEADLRESHLEEANLFQAHLERAPLASAHLERANLWHANLERAVLVFAHLEGADLSSAHLEEANLFQAHLERARLFQAHLERAYLEEAHLERADLESANLEGANLSVAHLEGASLTYAHLEGANLTYAHLEGASLFGTEFSHDTKFEDVEWGNYILGEEKRGRFPLAEATYRRLKIWYTEHGLYDIAGKFYYREMEAKRKAQSWKKPHLKIWYWVMRMLCGYGEKPERVIISAATIVFGLAAAYCLWGSFSASSFWDTLYYSVASFTALGYGQWAPQPTGWAKGVGAAEAVLGVSMLALFLVTFTRKMIR